MDDKHVDESWKDQVAKEKDSAGCGAGAGDACECGHDHGAPEVSFINYLMSMGYQAMIFLGQVPHPMTGKQEQNLEQARFLIDTIAMLKEKTRGNLNAQEEQFMDGTLYELQMKFVELNKGASGGSSPIIH